MRQNDWDLFLLENTFFLYILLYVVQTGEKNRWYYYVCHLFIFLADYRR
jgi:hypothetical protein